MSAPVFRAISLVVRNSLGGWIEIFKMPTQDAMELGRMWCFSLVHAIGVVVEHYCTLLETLFALALAVAISAIIRYILMGQPWLHVAILSK